MHCRFAEEETMNVTDGLMIAAVLLSPLVALSVERWRRKADARSEREREVLFDLVRARAATRGPNQVPGSAEIMERALNAIPVVFSHDTEIRGAFRAFYEARTKDGSVQSGDQKLVDLLLTICRRLGYKKVEESTLRNVLFLGRKP
jgi:hypothetical protein